MHFCCLGSGSKGNATLVRHGKTLLMIDCGFSTRQAVERLAAVGCGPEEISAILVTHEHSDHISGVSGFARKYGIPVHATRGTAKTGKLRDVEALCYLELDQPIRIGEIAVHPVAVPHDANEPCQFVLEAEGKRLGVMTDLGSISPHVLSIYDGCHALLLEANHDLEMLWSGSYPMVTKQRVASAWGHLSNLQAERFLQEINLDLLETLVLGHISEQNNHMDIVKRHFSTLEGRLRRVVYATQESGFSWLDV